MAEYAKKKTKMEIIEEDKNYILNKHFPILTKERFDYLNDEGQRNAIIKLRQYEVLKLQKVFYLIYITLFFVSAVSAFIFLLCKIL